MAPRLPHENPTELTLSALLRFCFAFDGDVDRLAFDVVESPRPLDELSPYAIEPPHLDGYLVPRRGEFRIVELEGGRVRLEGTWRKGPDRSR